MGVDDIHSQLKETSCAISEIYWLQLTGYAYDQNELSRLLSKQEQLHREYLDSNSSSSPTSLYLACLHGLVQTSTIPQNDIINLKRNQIVISKKHNVPLGHWARFRKTASNEERKEVFDEFTSSAIGLSKLHDERFEISRSTLSKYDWDPLSLYLTNEGTQYERVESLLIDVGKEASKKIAEKQDLFSREIWNKNADYVDDYHAYGERIITKFEPLFAGINHVATFQKVTKKMEIRWAASIVSMAGGPRSFGSFVMPIRCKNEIRAYLPNLGNPLSNIMRTYHELGHVLDIHNQPKHSAVNDIADQTTEYFGFSELYSMLFDGLLRDSLYLTQELNFDAQFVDDFVGRQKFMRALYASYFVVRGLLKLKIWKNQLDTSECNSYFANIANKFYRPLFPGSYWMLDQMMVLNDLELPSYVASMVRSCELRAFLETEFQRDWWNSKNAGKFILDLIKSENPNLDWTNLDPKSLYNIEF